MSERFSRGNREKYWAEFWGTLFLTLTVNQVSPRFGNAFFIVGLSVLVIVFCIGHISKAHINPSLTLAFLFRNDTPKSMSFNDKFHVLMYLVSQYIGALSGGFISYMIGGSESAAIEFYIRKYDSGKKKYFEAFMGELVYTFFLCYVILQMATDKRLNNNQFYGL